MGYEVYITRKDIWFDEHGDAITLDEWLDYVRGDPDMRADGHAETTTPDGSTLRIEDPGIAVWTAYSGHTEDGNKAWFMHHGDCVSVKNADEEIRGKMFEIATSLGGNVQGEEGERYDAHGHAFGMDEPEAPEGGGQPRPWWRFWG